MKIKKTYEIIDTKPTSILTSIPLIDLYIYIHYYILFFYFICKRIFLEKNFRIFSKKNKYFFKGYELTDFITLEDSNKNIVIKTTFPEFTQLFFYYNKDAKSLLNNLINEGFEIDLNKLSNNFIIKEKLEFFKKDLIIDLKKEVYINNPKFLEKIKQNLKFFNI